MYLRLQTKVMAMQWPLLHLNGQLVSLVGLFWFWQRSWPWSGTHCSEWGHLTIFWAPMDLHCSSGNSQHPSTSSESSPSGHWVSKLSQTLESGRQVPSLQLQPGLPIISWTQCRPFSLILSMPSSVELKYKQVSRIFSKIKIEFLPIGIANDEAKQEQE